MLLGLQTFRRSINSLQFDAHRGKLDDCVLYGERADTEYRDNVVSVFLNGLSV